MNMTHIKTELVSTTYKRKNKKTGEKIDSYIRTKTVYYLLCDNCDKSFTRLKGVMHESRLKYNHICKKCGPSASSKIGQKVYRANRLKETPIGTVRNRKGKSAYPVIFLGYGDDNYTRNDSSGWARHHTYVMEHQLNRKMKKGEIVHHIDGDRTNNNIDNLVLMTVAEHNKCHATSEEIIFEMVKQNLVIFDRRTNSYKLRLNNMIEEYR